MDTRTSRLIGSKNVFKYGTPALFRRRALRFYKIARFGSLNFGMEIVMPLTRLVYYSENQLDPAQGSVVAQLAKT